MKNLMLLTVISILIASCASDYQESKMSLYDINIPFTPTDSQEKSYIETIDVGPEEKRVPIQISWITKADEKGCLRISGIKVSRVGGSTDTVISNVKHSAIPECGMKWESQDETRFQTAIIQLSYESRNLLKTYNFKGSVASILGNGEFEVL